MSAALAGLAAAMVEAFSPLDRALRDPAAFRALVRELGWDKEAGDALGQGALGEVAAAPWPTCSPAGVEIAADLDMSGADNDAVFEELFDVAAVAARARRGAAGPRPAATCRRRWTTRRSGRGWRSTCPSTCWCDTCATTSSSCTGCCASPA